MHQLQHRSVHVRYLYLVKDVIMHIYILAYIGV